MKENFNDIEELGLLTHGTIQRLLDALKILQTPFRENVISLIHGIRRTLVEKDRCIAEKDRCIAEKDRCIAEKEKRIEESDVNIADLQKQVEDSQVIIAQLRKKNTASELTSKTLRLVSLGSTKLGATLLETISNGLNEDCDLIRKKQEAVASQLSQVVEALGQHEADGGEVLTSLFSQLLSRPSFRTKLFEPYKYQSGEVCPFNMRLLLNIAGWARAIGKLHLTQEQILDVVQCHSNMRNCLIYYDCCDSKNSVIDKSMKDELDRMALLVGEKLTY